MDVNPLSLPKAPIATLILAFTLVVTLSSCTVSDRQRVGAAIGSDHPEKAIAEYVKDKQQQYQQSPQQLIKDLKSLPQLFDSLDGIVKAIWGAKFAELPGNKKYVKYTNDYQSMAQVDFAKGMITVETIAQQQPLLQLKKAIVITLLTNEDPVNTDIFSDKTPNLAAKPYLLNQVLDHEGKAIAYQWRANRFADYLIKNQLQQRRINKHNSRFVQIQMTNNHGQLRKQQYASYVLAAAKRYQVRADLIYAIIETESSFNPFAVSRSNAYGLMQVIPATAGKDVYEKVLKKPGMPSRQTLFRVKDNIDIGTAYVHILQSRYLAKINHWQSRHYAVISAYNGGAGNVFKTFSQNRQDAPNVINRLSPSKVYNKLTLSHPRSESRRYLQKVIKAQTHY